MKKRLTNMLCAGLLAAAGFAGNAVAQDMSMKEFETMLKETADKVGLACGPEVDKFCTTVNPGEGRVIMCMIAHSDQISKDCSSALLDAAVVFGDEGNFFQYAASVCEADIEKSCGGIEPGDGKIAACLQENQASVSQPCQEAIKAYEMRLQ